MGVGRGGVKRGVGEEGGGGTTTTTIFTPSMHAWQRRTCGTSCFCTFSILFLSLFPPSLPDYFSFETLQFPRKHSTGLISALFLLSFPSLPLVFYSPFLRSLSPGLFSPFPLSSSYNRVILILLCQR